MKMPTPRAPRRRLLLAVATVTALAAAGIAIAGPGLSGSTSLVAASFYANTLVRSHTQTCTAMNNDAITITDATFTGSATSTDARLAGPVSIRVKSVYDSTTNAGSLTGEMQIAGTASPPAPGHFYASLDAVDVNGNVQGFLAGALGGGSRFLGSFSATFSPTGGFSSSGTQATIGAGSTTNTAVVSGGAVCAPTPSPPHPGVGNGPPKPLDAAKLDDHGRGHDHDRGHGRNHR
jgi:hypothetical protein